MEGEIGRRDKIAKRKCEGTDKINCEIRKQGRMIAN
jgi:hypothetical protein